MHSHSLPQRQQGRGQQEAGGRRGRGLCTRGPGARPRRGGGGRRRVGVLVTAHAANIRTTLAFVCGYSLNTASTLHLDLGESFIL